MEMLLDLFSKKRKNQDILYRNFNFTFCLKLFLLMVLAGIFFDNPANSVTFSVYPLEEAVRLNLRPPVIILTGMILGPIWGAVAGGFIDISSFLIWHIDMNYMFIFTLLTMLRGFISGYIFNFIFKRFSWKSVVTSIAFPHLLISGIIIPVALYYNYGVPLINNVRIRLIIQIFTIPIFTVIFYYILKGMKKSKELKTLHSKLKDMLKIDDLTGLSNRRHFMDFLNKMHSLSQRHGHSLSILMADIDNFKEINDNYGHHKGDQFLRAVGDILKRKIRNEDLAARMGGDEFVILLPETSLKEALYIAHRIKKCVKNIDILSEKENSSISIGAAQLKEDDDTESFLKRVDDALYQAKEKGRNRVETISIDPSQVTKELEFS